jgi:DNA-directed RNA polymerase subunit RPC12/RpoP
MENNNMNRMQMIREKINSLPSGSISQSNHYWCVTCKKFFVLDKPECPYMSGMCVNTPIAVENLPPESTESLEKFGLFYPKIPQRLLSELISDKYRETGENLARIYLGFLREWKFDKAPEQPLQTIKSFIILLSGCETAQRVNGNSVTFVLMDAGKIWEKSKIKDILEGGLGYLKYKLNIGHKLKIDFIDILGERETGKYFCAKCGMFFEFGLRRESVTCPLMSQKCMFDPQHIDKISYTSDKMLKQYKITPDIYKRFIKSIGKQENFTENFRKILAEWKITEGQDEIIKEFGMN